MKQTLLAVDGNSLMHRAFYALPLLTNKDGEYTNAVYGFFSMLISAVQTLNPTHVAIAFDMKGKTFRHDVFAEYKGTRKPTPDELIPQFPLLKDAISAIGITLLEKEGYEADDLLGLLSKQAGGKDMDAVLLTGDKDIFQLVSDSCRVMLTKKGVSELDIVDRKRLKEMYELIPSQIVDLKGFMGDSSDNIPGVPGVGEKTALKLLHAYHDMDGVFAHIDEISGKLKEKLMDNKQKAYMSRELATIETNVPCDISVDAMAFEGFASSNIAPVFEKLGFTSLLKRIGQEKEAAKPVEQITIDNMTDLNRIMLGIRQAEYIALTFGDDITLADEADSEYVIKAEHSLLNMDFSRDMVMQVLAPVLADVNINKVVHDAKQIDGIVSEYGVSLGGVLFDTKLAEYVIDPGTSKFDLENMCKKYTVSGNAAALMQLYPLQKKRMERSNLLSIYRDIEAPLTGVLLDMEKTGFRIDLELLDTFSCDLKNRIADITSRIYELCGFDDFNINSTKQLGTVLFERLGLPAAKKTKTGYSTDIEVLEKLSGKHPVIEHIIEYRRLTKLNSTYIDGLKKIADARGFVHTTFVQISTVTGRISSKEPNLQNIPIRTQEGREIRRLFVPSDETRNLVTADYSQIELRILAAISGDSVMQHAFASGTDIHTRTASEVFGVPPDEVTADMRRNAKAVNFGIVYGISDFGLARNLGISVKKAGSYIERYFQRFSGVKQYMDSIKQRAKDAGFVTTLLGRRRYLPELRSRNYNIRSFGERAALNTPIQGTAADIIKLAMIDVWQKLKDGGYKSRLILQVHDELIIDAVPDEIDAVKKLLKDSMENAYKLDVSLIAEVGVGDNWLNAK